MIVVGQTLADGSQYGPTNYNREPPVIDNTGAGGNGPNGVDVYAPSRGIRCANGVGGMRDDVSGTSFGKFCYLDVLTITTS